tara:strand:- start:790 stop:1017 length:228 start_codon:yes stop_codon:yes gene_type:complete
MVLSYILNKIKLYYNYNEIELIRMNLKHTKTLKKRFFIPKKEDILNKMYTIKYRNNPRFNKTELIKIKESLKPIY